VAKLKMDELAKKVSKLIEDNGFCFVLGIIEVSSGQHGTFATCPKLEAIGMCETIKNDYFVNENTN